jgi:hydroxypyruvate isomerase
MDRRSFLGASLAAVTLPRQLQTAGSAPPAPAPDRARAITKGRIKQSVARWCYGGIEIETLCRESAKLGYASVELLNPPEWNVPKKHGLVCALGFGPGPIDKGWNRKEHHDHLLAESERLLPIAKADGVPSLVVFSGNRAGISEEEGLANCIAGLKRVAPLAEKHGVTLVLEILNSKVDHHDYQFDHMSFGVAVVDAVGSERIKILYDIYHAQIMEGDVIRTLQQNKDRIGHYHTGGVPGRHEIDETQEIYYPAICKAIVATGYQGYVAQEFVPSRDPLASLAQAGTICDV